MTMKVKIKYGGFFSELIKKSEDVHESDEKNLSMKQLLIELFNKYLDLAKFFDNNPLKVFDESMVIINNKVVNPNEINIININDNDLVMFLPIVTGG